MLMQPNTYKGYLFASNQLGTNINRLKTDLPYGQIIGIPSKQVLKSIPNSELTRSQSVIDLFLSNVNKTGGMVQEDFNKDLQITQYGVMKKVKEKELDTQKFYQLLNLGKSILGIALTIGGNPAGLGMLLTPDLKREVPVYGPNYPTFNNYG